MKRKDPFGNVLPNRVYYRSGSYWYVEQNQWSKLGRDYAVALQNYAGEVAPSGEMLSLIYSQYQHYEKRVDAGDLAASSLKQYRMVRERIEVAFGTMAPSSVRPPHIAQFLDFYFEDMQAQGNTCRAVLSAIFARGVRHGKCDFNPVREVERFKSVARDRYLTDEEWDAIYAHSPDWLRQIMGMCYLTAQRIGDVLHIKQTDIGEEGIAFQQQKSKKRLVVETSPALVDLVREIRASHKIAGVYLFTGTSHSKPRGYSSVCRAWKKSCEAAGIDNARIHDIRAKALTDADAQGLDAQSLAGHESAAMTRRYLRLRRTERVVGVTKLRRT